MAFFIMLDGGSGAFGQSLDAEIEELALMCEIVQQTMNADVSQPTVSAAIDPQMVTVEANTVTLDILRSCVSVSSPSADETWCLNVLAPWSFEMRSGGYLGELYVDLHIGHNTFTSPVLQLLDPWADMRAWLESIGF